MKHWMKWTPIACGMLFACSLVQISCVRGDTEKSAETIFNRRFTLTIRPSMTYEEVVKLAGGQGAKIGEDKSGSLPTAQYRWDGKRESILTVRFSDNKMLDATVRAPNGHTYLIKNSGEVVDITK